jgi:hypothetical protein
LRVLVENDVRPILMIAFTNQALDHLLRSVIDAGITRNIVRLGGSSSDEKIAEYNIQKQEEAVGRTRLDYAFAKNHHDLKNVEETLREVLKQYVRHDVDSQQVTEYLELHHPEEFAHITIHPPPWIARLHELTASAGAEGTWQQVGARGQRTKPADGSLYEYWRSGQDLAFLGSRPQAAPEKQTPPPHPTSSTGDNPFSALATVEAEFTSDEDSESAVTAAEEPDSLEDEDDDAQWMRALMTMATELAVDDVEQELKESQPSADTAKPAEPPAPTPERLGLNDVLDPVGFFRAFGYDRIPLVPSGDRSLQELFEESDPWFYSQIERDRLHQEWSAKTKTALDQREREEFEHLRARHAEALDVYQQGKNEVSSSALSVLYSSHANAVAGPSSYSQESRHHRSHHDRRK